MAGRLSDRPGAAAEVEAALAVARGLTTLDRLEALDGYATAMAEATANMLDRDVDVLEVSQHVAAVNDVLTARLLALAEGRLGAPPYAYAWLALGSHGRGEQTLSSDQDNAVAYGGPRLTSGQPKDYFGELAHLVVEGLARAGIAHCSGGYMATVWRHPLETYTEYFRRWVDDPQPSELLKAEVFLDVRPVHGDLDVSRLDDVLVAGGRRSAFLAQMARAAISFRPPHVLFGHVQSDHGVIDVKRSGTAAIVLLARLYALAGGSRARTTALRLRDAAAAGALSSSGAAQLTDAYRVLSRLRLRHQVEQARRGEPLDNKVRVSALTPADRRGLREAIRTVTFLQEFTASRYQTHTLT